MLNNIHEIYLYIHLQRLKHNFYIVFCGIFLISYFFIILPTSDGILCSLFINTLK